jgi:hypothetical protein
MLEDGAMLGHRQLRQLIEPGQGRIDAGLASNQALRGLACTSIDRSGSRPVR